METPMKKWLCIVCGLIYDEAKGWPSDGIAPGTRWEDVPDDWLCPDCLVGKADFEMIEITSSDASGQATEAVTPAKEDPIVIIGSGYAGYRLSEALRQRRPEQPIAIFTQDDGADYSKPGLSNALARGKAADELVAEAALDIEQRLNIRIYAHTRVKSVDTQAHVINTDIGSLRYAKLVFAIGAEPVRIPFAGSGSEDVLSVNDLGDYRQFRSRLAPNAHVTLIGNGLIGCEFANDLSAAGHSVTVVGLTHWAMDRMLPEAIGTRLQARLSAAGVSWQLGSTVETIDKLDDGYRVTLTNGEQFETSLVLSAVGLKPRTELAKSAGIKCEQGIVVNGGLRTSAADTFALGDCAQVNGQLLPYIAPINAAIPALADCLLGRPTMAHYPLMPVIVKTPIYPLTLLMAPNGTAGHWVVQEQEDGQIGLFVDDAKVVHGFALAGACAVERQKWVDRISQGYVHAEEGEAL